MNFWITFAQPIATSMGGLMVLVAAWLTFHSAKKSRESLEQQSREMIAEQQTAREEIQQRETVKALRERFTIVASQLADSSLPIRIAGVYALATLADDWHAYGFGKERQNCIDVLCAYLRAAPDVAAAENDVLVRSAIIQCIREHTIAGRGNWRDARFNLSGAILKAAHLEGIEMFGADFRGADLVEANLHNTVLKKVNLSDARMDWALMGGANMEHAQLANASLVHATLYGCNLRHAWAVRADFSGCTLAEADISFAEVAEATFRSTNMRAANAYSVNFANAALRGADDEHLRHDPPLTRKPKGSRIAFWPEDKDL